MFFTIVTYMHNGYTFAYIFWIKSYDNTIRNIQQIEKKHKIYIPIVAFIFDPRSETAYQTIQNLKHTLGKNRVYHITISPSNTSSSYSSKQVAEWIFDDTYIKVFKSIKEQNIKVVFRTMHEMNWGRYPRCSDPINFKKARTHVRELSRNAGLNKNNILFDFSANHRDMPTDETPGPNAKLIKCTPKEKKKSNCFSFEDYYPGDKYVDIFWFTFYNWGKGSSHRAWLTPKQTLYDTNRNTLERIKKFNKPIFIDEVGTTAVRYEWDFDPQKSKEVYDQKRDYKNYRLMHFKEFLKEEPLILGFTYFNTDYTNGLQKKLGPWEADRAIIDPSWKKTYFWSIDLYKNSDLSIKNKLVDLFNTVTVQTPKRNIYINKKEANLLQKIISIFTLKTIWEFKTEVRANTKLSLQQKSNRYEIINLAEMILTK